VRAFAKAAMNHARVAALVLDAHMIAVRGGEEK